MLQNKWTGKKYEVVKDLGKDIVLKCIDDNKVINIQKSELNFNYREFKEKTKCK